MPPPPSSLRQCVDTISNTRIIRPRNATAPPADGRWTPARKACDDPTCAISGGHEPCPRRRVTVSAERFPAAVPIRQSPPAVALAAGGLHDPGGDPHRVGDPRPVRSAQADIRARADGHPQHDRRAVEGRRSRSRCGDLVAAGGIGLAIGLTVGIVAGVLGGFLRTGEYVFNGVAQILTLSRCSRCCPCSSCGSESMS